MALYKLGGKRSHFEILIFHEAIIKRRCARVIVTFIKVPRPSSTVAVFHQKVSRFSHIILYWDIFLTITCAEQLKQVLISLMGPRKDPIPRRSSGSLVRFEPIDTSLIEQYINHVDSFKHLGCWRFCQKLQGYHLEVSRDFVQNYMDGKTKIGPLEINVIADMIVEVTEIPRTREQWFKAKKFEKEY
jgi:hypothetical protein